MTLLDREEAARRAAAIGLPSSSAELNVYRTLLHAPALAQAVATLTAAGRNAQWLTPRLRELVILRVAWRTACDYEWSQHWGFGQTQGGLTTDEITAVRDGSVAFEGADQLVLAAVDDLVDQGRLLDARLAAFPDTAATLETIGVAQAYLLLSAVLRTFDVPLDDGLTSWPPDGRAPGN